MGEAVYTFDRSVQDTLQLANYIQSTLPGVEYTTCSGSLTSVAFAGSLTGTQATTLNGLMQQYPDLAPPPNTISESSGMDRARCSNQTWTSMHTFLSRSADIQSVTATTCLVPNTPSDAGTSGFSYSVRVVDITNNVILGQTQLTNSALQDNAISLSGLSSSPATLELQAMKGTGGAYIDLTTMHVTKVCR
jgi:hypothetical protein